MMIGKPTDVGTPQAALRTGATPSKRVESGASSDERVDGVVPSDSVEVSDTGRALAAGSQAADEFRADKVAAVKKALEEGTYQVRAKIVADRMITEAAELLESMAASR